MGGMKRFLGGFLALAMVCQTVPITAKASGSKLPSNAITSIKAKSANDHGVELAIDGDKATYWQTIPSGGEGDTTQQAYSSMYAHNHYIDITLDGTYQLSDIKVFNKVDGSYSNYYIYASTDGENYTKIVSKTSNDVATAEGDSFSVNAEASYLRINMAYNSNAYTTNLAELELYGTKTSETVKKPAEIKVDNWEGSKWQTEWNKFETDPVYAEQKVKAEMSNLVERVLNKDWRDKFVFEMRGSLTDTQDIFEIDNGANDTIVIRGNNGIAMASGFNHYIKYYLNLDFNPLFGSNVDVTDKKIVPVEKKIVKEAQFDLRYALNFCTYSYTMAFWNWDEYEEFLDWAAMNGLNLILDIVGQEEVLRQTFLEYNFTNEEIKDYLCGPAYFAWFYMQNLYSVGGPLPDSWFAQRVELGRQMHDRMQTYGISPVLQGFSGQVPETFPAKNEGAELTPVDFWPGHTRPSLLKPYGANVDYFSQVAETFYAKQENVFGDISDYYATDPFHEGGNTGGLDIATIFQRVQEEMMQSNPDAKWVMQQWQGNLNSTKMSLLDTSQCIALDLQADMNPQHGLFEENDTPWIYCMLHNFGGRMGLDGELPVISTDPIVTANNTQNMKGIGITPEALENSPIAYELFLETTWTTDPIKYDEWVDKYAERRAGKSNDDLQKAWDILAETAYADKSVYYQGAAETVINARPGDSFGAASSWGHSGIYYDKEKLDEALKILAENYETFGNSLAYKYDLADVAEQLLCNAAVEYHKLMVAAKNADNLEQFEKLSNDFLGLIDLSDQILATTDEFMLGTWITAAREMITDADDWTKDLFEYNARALVTTWGGEKAAGNGGLKDYSNRKWSGLTSSFYKERWAIWIDNRIAELRGQAKDPAKQKAEDNWFLWEFQWVNRKSDDDNGIYAFSAEPSDADLGKLALDAYEKYSYTNIEKNTGLTVEDKVNIVLGKTPELTAGTTAGGDIANITDNNTGTEWKGTGTEDHSLEFDLEGNYEINEIILSVPQLANKYPYTYKIEAYDSETDTWNELASYTDSEGLDSNTTISVNGTGSKLRFTIATTDATNDQLTVTEIKVYGKFLSNVAGEKKLDNMTLNQPAEVTISGGGTTDAVHPIVNITDGTLEQSWRVAWIDNVASLFPTTVKIPLKETAYVNYIELDFEATEAGKSGRPFKFYVEVVKEDGTTERIYNEYENLTGTLPKTHFEITVEQTIKDVIVCMNGTTQAGDYGLSSPALAEMKAMGTPVEYRNVVLGQTPEVTISGGGTTNPSQPIKNITDGKTNTFWAVQWVNNNVTPSYFPTTVTVPLQQPTYVDYLELDFEATAADQTGRPYKFYVEVVKEDGTTEKIYNQYEDHEGTLPKETIKINVGQTIQKVIVCLNGTTQQGSVGASTPAIAEIKAMSAQPVQGESIDFTEGKISGLTVSGGNATNNVLDGNKDTWDVVTKDEEIVFALPDYHYVKNVDITFEKGQLGLNYMVYAEDAKGNRTLVCDRSKTEELLGEAGDTNRITINVPVEQAAKKIIFVHMGNNGKGPASQAEHRLYEFEVYGGKPVSALTGATVTPTEASVLVDNNTATTYTTTDTSIEVTLAKPTDINMVSVKKAEGETMVLTYDAEYWDEASGEWRTFASVSGSSEQEAFAASEEIAFTQKVRFTIPAGMNLSEVQVYKVDTSKPLRDRIEEIKTILDGFYYDGTNGSRTPEAKQAVVDKLTIAEAAIAEGISSAQVKTWMATLDNALDTFYKSEIVYVDRTNLLIILSDADQMLKGLDKIGLATEKTTLQNAYGTAKAVYDTYKVTQADLNGAETTLAGVMTGYKKLYDVSYHKGAKVSKDWTAPTAEGKVFAGWYADNTCEEIYKEKTGIAYPKFVAAEVLAVKGQVPINAGDIKEGSEEKTRIRFVSTIDNCYDYQKVGFHIKYTNSSGLRDIERESTQVYDELYAAGTPGDKITPKDFYEGSAHFFAYSIWDIPYGLFQTEFEVTAYWITGDGTKVYGTSRSGNDTLSVQKGIEKNAELLR